jgi:DNA-binding NtrC family response regulator
MSSQILIITGMHGSGMSLVARNLHPLSSNPGRSFPT